MKVKPKLNLNMNPAVMEEGTLCYANNMKVDTDGILTNDYGYKDIEALSDVTNIIGYIIGIDNKIYFLTSSNDIIEYDEELETVNYITSEWTYSNGKITGYVTTNISGEKILTIAESDAYKIVQGERIPIDVPLKHINLSHAIVADESLYCQAPKVPITNIKLRTTYNTAIPNGVYVFFIRYRIRKDVYTKWYLASRPLFAGTSENIATLQGGLKYINTHKDAAKAFVFDVEHLIDDNKAYYDSFQLGFIVTHEEATDARIWKEFPIDTNIIYFDYDDIKETNIDDMLETTYELYNVKNIASFKNKLYISNYKETNFAAPERLSDINLGITLNYVKETVGNNNNNNNNNHDYASTPVATLTVNNREYFLVYDNNERLFTQINLGNTTQNLSTYLANNYNIVFNYTFNDPVKTKTDNWIDAATVKLYWHPNQDPDLVIVKAVVDNHLYKNGPFNSFTIDDDYWDYTSNNHASDSKIGLYFPAISSANDYAGNVIKKANSSHKWHDHIGGTSISYTYAFSSAAGTSYAMPSQNQDAYNANIAFINEDNFDAFNSVDSNIPIDGYPCTNKGGDSFTISGQDAIYDRIEKDINKLCYFGLIYHTVSYGGRTYEFGKTIDTDENVTAESTNYSGYVTSGNNRQRASDMWVTNPIFTDDYDGWTNKIPSGMQNTIKYRWRNIVSSNFIGIDLDGYLIFEIDGVRTRLESLNSIGKHFRFKTDFNKSFNTTDGCNTDVRISFAGVYYSIKTNIGINGLYITPNNQDYVKLLSQRQTLLPLATYKNYIHFVDEHNIITKGLEYSTDIKTPAVSSGDDVFNIKYTINADNYNEKYKAFFISTVLTSAYCLETFDYRKNGNTHSVSCIESDALLFNINDNITIVKVASNDNTSYVPVTSNAKYCSSGCSNPLLAFGNCGFIYWTNDDTDYSGQRLYVLINHNNNNNGRLVKSSEYIPIVTTNVSSDETLNFKKLQEPFFNSYFCSVIKPTIALSSTVYVSGTDIYRVTRSTVIELEEISTYLTMNSITVGYIRSPFNINYLSLTEEVKDKVFSVGTSSNKQVAKVINSATLSFIYELKSMYKDFTNKYFSKNLDNNARIIFDNTIRVSNVLSDETFNNSIFTFRSTDYYNIPANRGPIVNLFTISNNIFVHSIDAFYKFDGNQTIVSSDNDITLKESEPFDIGITQIIDSAYGYGGIRNKEAGCITFDSYFFYDATSNHIFAYGGNSQINIIDTDIHNLIKYYNPIFCRTLHDEINNRILFEFTSNRPEHANVTNKTFTLSYNYKTKSFVSFHDITLDKAFSSRHFVYSYRGESYLNRLFYDGAIVAEALYGSASKTSLITYGVAEYKDKKTVFNLAVLMFPNNNIIKANVDSIKLITYTVLSSIINNPTTNEDVINTPTMLNNLPVELPISNFYIKTDSCISTPINKDTTKINIQDTSRDNAKVNNFARPNSLLDYKGFKYDMGVWNCNYFRNNINITNVFQYPNQPGVNIPVPTTIDPSGRVTRIPNSDNYSLVYGRYFILNFDFVEDAKIKFEEIFINSNLY